MSAGLFAVSDLHVDHPENRELLQQMRPDSPRDWLIVAGDVADDPATVEWALRLLAERYARLIWVPGNHELLTHGEDPLGLRGERRYLHLVELCRRLGVLTPEDPFPRWEGDGGPATLAPLFLLYDYSFGRNVGASKEEALRRAHDAGVVCVDEYLLHPDPFPSREAWCGARVAEAERRLAAVDPALPTVLINHFPLLEAPTRVLRHPEFAQWCGTVATADWHRRFRAVAAVYGHLHIPRTTWHDGVRFEEVSLGYPRERARWGGWSTRPRRVLPEAESA
ncbi:MAG TPA: metallophosphoesterase [Solirubrobacterales bacterium]|nr:metallophosphoesterase [Solirubrobacterales bacterium]